MVIDLMLDLNLSYLYPMRVQTIQFLLRIF